MRIPSTIVAPLDNERGIALVTVGIWMTALFALTAVGVDVGRVAFTASEVQSVADVAALTGARALLDGGNAQTAADTVLGSGGGSPNTVNGTSAYSAATTTVVTGTVTNAGTFTAGGGAAANAAQATSVATVTNLFTGIFGGANGSTTVTKVATAVITTTTSQRPDLPMALSGGCFDSFNCTAGNCPSLNTQTNNAGWTGLFTGHSASDASGFIPTPCGGGNTAPVVNVGDVIDATNGTAASVFHDFHCLVCVHSASEFLLAVVNKTCTSGFNGDFTVTGFATVVVDTATYCAAGHDEKVVPLLAVRRAGASGGVGGCANCGTGFIRLIG